MKAAADSAGYVAKFPLPIVEKQLRRLSVADPAHVAHGIIDVSVDDRQIEPAIEIGIQKYTAESQSVF